MKTLSISMSRTETTLGFLYLAVQLLILPALLLQMNLLLENPLTTTQLNFLFFCIDFVCIAVFFHRFLFASVQAFFQHIKRSLGGVIWGLILYAGTSFATNSLILFVYPDFTNINDGSIFAMVQENLLFTAIGTILLVPPVEEVLYRGVVFKTLHDRSPILGYIVSALAFSALHVISYVGKYSPVHLLLCFVQYLPAALCLSWSYVRTDTIATPILMHMCINFVGILSMR